VLTIPLVVGLDSARSGMRFGFWPGLLADLGKAHAVREIVSNDASAWRRPQTMQPAILSRMPLRMAQRLLLRIPFRSTRRHVDG
jgi:hypothetical protein